MTEREEMLALDPLTMLLDAARYIEDSKPAWAAAARKAVAEARLAARPDAGYVVKALEWKPYASDGSTHRANTVVGSYVTWEINGRGYFSTPERHLGGHVEGDWKAAKAAAQADYEQRIRSALLEQPATPTKKTYIKPLRTIVEIDERYSDKIRDLLNAPATSSYAASLDQAVEVGWSAMVGHDIAATCHNASIIRGDLRTALEAALSALPAPAGAAEEWQEISTAPRDGRSLRLSSNGWPTIGSWNKYRNDWCINGGNYPAYDADEKPTHWKPLDEPPHITAKAKEK